ncbi:segregation/condensation protein A [Patescibacteria group bacterium]|nr:segregation/condensation protein A [Patescibacteria group bacterium]
MVFAVEQEKFSGPLGLLLDLLAKKELEIKDVALAQIADGYLAYLDAHDVPPDEMADFLLVASRLIYIKSRELMPYLRQDEEEEQVESLEDQLQLYRMFADAASRLQELYKGRRNIFDRPYVKVKLKTQPEFVEPVGVGLGSLGEAFRSLMRRLEPFFALQETSIERIKSVEERLDELKGAITSRVSMTFKEIVKGAKSKAEVVVTFLALLELVHRQVVKAQQKRDNEIIISRI